MDGGEITRRRLLSVGGVTASTAVAGCLQFGGGSQGSGTATSGSESPGASAAYERWLLAPSEVAFGPPILLTSLHLGELLDYGDALPKVDTSRFQRTRSVVPVSEIEYVHNHGSLVATTGTFEAAPVEEKLKQRYGKSGEYDGYTVFSKEDVGAIGVKDGVLLKSLWYTDADVRRNLREFVDTGQGEYPRLHEVDETGRILVDALDGATGVRINTGDVGRIVEGAVAAGSRVDVGSDTSELGVVVVFEDESAVSAERVRTRLGETEFFDSADAIPTRVEGRAVVVEDTIPTADVGGLQISVEPATLEQ